MPTNEQSTEDAYFDLDGPLQVNEEPLNSTQPWVSVYLTDTTANGEKVHKDHWAPCSTNAEAISRAEGVWWSDKAWEILETENISQNEAYEKAKKIPLDTKDRSRLRLVGDSSTTGTPAVTAAASAGTGLSRDRRGNKKGTRPFNSTIDFRQQ